MKKIGVLRFPGTNCDRDIWQAVETVGCQPGWLWHKDRFNPRDYNAFIIPGGFSYGDYLRTGALAALSPVMESLKEAAEKGAPVLGICNGFQILCEAGLLPGVLLKNKKLKFIDTWVELSMGTSLNIQKLRTKEKIKLPIAHGDGRYYADKVTLQKIKEKNQIFCTYTDNPNGSVENIAGVTNEQGNVMGLMPHPERAMFNWMGSIDGYNFFENLV